MTHDPLCPIGQTCTIGSRDGFHVLYQVRQGSIACDCCDRTCGCDLIAMVRADTLNTAAQAVKAVPIDGPWIESEAHESAIHQAVVAINALRGES